jgi:hypothetical protein
MRAMSAWERTTVTRHQYFHASVLALACTSPLAIGGSPATPYQALPQAVDYPDDVDLTDRVFGRLCYDDILRDHLGNVQVSARNGWVTLSGSVIRDTVRGRMGQVAKSVNGVERVVNLLVVVPE